MLGVSVERLRLLVKRHIVMGDDLPENVNVFEPSDLLVLKFLVGREESHRLAS